MGLFQYSNVSKSYVSNRSGNIIVTIDILDILCLQFQLIKFI